MKKPLNLPQFPDEASEFEFWSTVNLADYFEAADLKPVCFPNLKPTSQSISLRLPQYLLNRIKERANAIDVPYQSLIKAELKKSFFGT